MNLSLLYISTSITNYILVLLIKASLCSPIFLLPCSLCIIVSFFTYVRMYVHMYIYLSSINSIILHLCMYICTYIYIIQLVCMCSLECCHMVNCNNHICRYIRHLCTYIRTYFMFFWICTSANLKIDCSKNVSLVWDLLRLASIKLYFHSLHLCLII